MVLSVGHKLSQKSKAGSSESSLTSRISRTHRPLLVPDRSRRALETIGQLYEIEAEIRERTLPHGHAGVMARLQPRDRSTCEHVGHYFLPGG